MKLKTTAIIISVIGLLGAGYLFRTSLCRSIIIFAALTKSTDQFLRNSKDPRVMYEPGAENAANVIAQELPAAISTIESKQYRKFAAPIKIYICASVQSFKTYGANERAGGLTSNDRVFISPKPENTPERLPRVLTHELSHLHMEQYVGIYRWWSGCPVWFQEGLAAYVSNGGGAEGVTEAEAQVSIAKGKTFDPEKFGSLLHKSSAAYFGLDEHMFYKQSSMFISYLENVDELKFKNFIMYLQNGRSFSLSFSMAYGEKIKTVWDSFVLKIKAGVFIQPRNDGDPDLQAIERGVTDGADLNQ